jgi:hypothetical protein
MVLLVKLEKIYETVKQMVRDIEETLEWSESWSV